MATELLVICPSLIVIINNKRAIRLLNKKREKLTRAVSLLILPRSIHIIFALHRRRCAVRVSSFQVGVVEVVRERDVPPRSFVGYLHEVSRTGSVRVRFYLILQPRTHIYITTSTSFPPHQIMRFGKFMKQHQLNAGLSHSVQ